MVKSSCPERGLVLDPFAGSGTTVEACIKNSRHYLAYEINPEYYDIIQNRAIRAKSEYAAILNFPHPQVTTSPVPVAVNSQEQQQLITV
jgi:DNA modification methylase